LKTIILKIAIILVVIAVIIQVVHVPSEYSSTILDIFKNSEITNALLIIQYLFAIAGTYLIIKFIIDKIFNKK